MDLQKQTKKAFFKALGRAENMLVFSKKTGVAYPVINKLNSGKSAFGNMTLSTFERLFPELELTFFADERSRDSNRVTAGDVYGGINQGGSVAGGIHVQNAGNQVPDALKTEIYGEVLEKLMDCQELDDTVKVKIYKILKQKQ